MVRTLQKQNAFAILQPSNSDTTMTKNPKIGLIFGTTDKPIRYQILNIENDKLQCRFFNTSAETSGYCEMETDYYLKAFAENKRFTSEIG